MLYAPPFTQDRHSCIRANDHSKTPQSVQLVHYERPMPTATFQKSAPSHENRVSGSNWLQDLLQKGSTLRSEIFMAAVLLASLAQAKEPRHYQTGTLLQMDSAECGVD